MKGFIQKQSSHSFLSFLLNKEKEKMRLEILQKINIDNEIISVIKEDSNYEVLFNEPLKPKLFENFESQIEKGKYEETKKVLHKK